MLHLHMGDVEIYGDPHEHVEGCNDAVALHAVLDDQGVGHVGIEHHGIGSDDEDSRHDTLPTEKVFKVKPRMKESSKLLT
ncbi:hypothetical protein AVEN_69144-1 [Araneus ventricosus]|uniref:Uncharacterized protein n=1 Tax=Araneus ventricosus TaxID=182803 RepID=A0A4Y1ZNI1_ARAVE|nr:hypothetical protein AVEN_69144-1 [Araneus ventricosus]